MMPGPPVEAKKNPFGVTTTQHAPEKIGMLSTGVSLALSATEVELMVGPPTVMRRPLVADVVESKMPGYEVRVAAPKVPSALTGNESIRPVVRSETNRTLPFAENVSELPPESSVVRKPVAFGIRTRRPFSMLKPTTLLFPDALRTYTRLPNCAIASGKAPPVDSIPVGIRNPPNTAKDEIVPLAALTASR